MKIFARFPGLLMALFCLSTNAAQKIELHNGDRVALVGGVFMEREQEDGYIETMLARSFSNRAVTFRNFGWGGDTVESHIAPKVPARPSYVPNLFGYLEKYKPNVVLISYGMMESFRGEAGLAEFSENYGKLLDKISAISSPRVILISPFPHEKLGGNFPDPTGHNRLLKLYVDATEKLARERGLIFVNLFESLPVAPENKKQLTSNGVHLNSEGYQQAAIAIQKALDLSPKKFKKSATEKLRAAIQHKNKQWWFHYRPMNSEYVYPGGTRYQNELGAIKLPMYSEIEEFAAMTEREEKQIFALLQNPNAPSVRNAKSPLKGTPSTSPAPPDPELERKTFQVADGFDVNLFAADPKITKPVQMAFDKKGRLWVATTTLYPQIKPGDEPSDSIIILEDRDGDGRADKTTVFAEGLVIPTGVLPYRDGAFVFDDTTLLFLRDTDGDGRADIREVVLSGFGTEDSHHKGHVLRWGPEGRLHFNAGVFLHNNIETAHGLVSLSGYWQPGIFAYDPLTGKLDIHLANSVPPNPWGHYWNRWGFDFHIDSSGQQGSNLILPTSNRTSSALPVPGGEGKLAGGEVVSGRHFPHDWQGNLISAPFKENRVARWEFSDDGSGYAMKPMSSLVVSTDSAFRPVDERMGPDGAIYISDWYNPLIGHMQHHFRDPGRDFTHGRIWRITAKDRPLVSRPDISGAPVKQLFEYLKAPEDYTRLQARRELAERPAKEVIPALSKWVKQLNTRDEHFDHQRLEALWVYQSLKTVEPTLLKSLLQAENFNARAASIVVLREWRKDISDSLSLLGTLVRDEHPRVRLQAVIALSYFPEMRAMESALLALEKPMDRPLEQALKNTTLALRTTWETALEKESQLFGGDSHKLEFVLNAAGKAANPRSLLALLRTGKLSNDKFQKAIDAIAANGSKEDLTALYRLDFAPDQQAKALSALAKAERERKLGMQVRPEQAKRLEYFLDSPAENVKAAALRLAGSWKTEGLRTKLAAIAQDKTASDELTIAAMDALASLGGKESALVLFRLASPDSPRHIREAAIVALASFNITNAAQRVADFLVIERSKDEVFTLLNSVLQRERGADSLGQIIWTGRMQIHPDNAKLALRALQMSGQQDATLLKALSEAAGIHAEPKELSRNEIETLAVAVREKGDAARGEEIFRRAELSCFQCHAIGGAGGKLGPDLGAVGSGSQMDYLIESLIAPDKIIKDGYETWETTTQDDEYVLGIKVRENARELVLKDAARDEIVIPTDRIKEKILKRTSLMPAGLTSSLTQSEFLDLCRFLGELGKPGPYANNPNSIIRRWQFISPAPEQATFAAAESLSWTPVYSTVSGILPLEEISQSGSAAKALVRTQFEITTPGRIQFIINSIEGIRFFIDGNPTELQATTILDLSRGVHSAWFEIDLKKRKGGLRVELEQTAGSPGRFLLHSGR